jgi:hypothetical protein
MGNAKRGGGSGAEEVLGPDDFAVAGAKARAAARVLAKQVEGERERVQSSKRGKERWRNPKFHITMTRERLPWGGGLITFRLTPVGLSAEDARRWVEEHGGAVDRG